MEGERAIMKYLCGLTPWSHESQAVVGDKPQGLITRMSRQAALSKVIWSAMLSPVKPGSRLANSTILMMHLVASSLNLSHSPRSSCTRWSALEFCSGYRIECKLRSALRAVFFLPNPQLSPLHSEALLFLSARLWPPPQALPSPRSD